MGARGNLGHDAAVGAVLFELAQYHVAEDPTGPFFIAQHDGSRGFIAACLNAEDAQRRGHDVVYSKIADTQKAGYTELVQRRASLRRTKDAVTL
ncbi:hypothetical protein GCM10007864_59450 [Sinorhizobium fredii]|nr:hypothetical protein GCM10007864_59450 [Sinorhizobium fredii]